MDIIKILGLIIISFFSIYIPLIVLGLTLIFGKFDNIYITGLLFILMIKYFGIFNIILFILTSILIICTIFYKKIDNLLQFIKVMNVNFEYYIDKIYLFINKIDETKIKLYNFICIKIKLEFIINKYNEIYKIVNNYIIKIILYLLDTKIGHYIMNKIYDLYHKYDYNKIYNNSNIMTNEIKDFDLINEKNNSILDDDIINKIISNNEFINNEFINTDILNDLNKELLKLKEMENNMKKKPKRKKIR